MNCSAIGRSVEYTGRLRKEEWEVRPVAIAVARDLVERYHYAKGASNTRTYLHGLFRRGAFWETECLGVAWWIPPTRSAAEATYPKNWQGVLALSRLVVAPEVPKNACTFLLGRSVKLIPAAIWPCLVTYADDWRGHIGTIYRACNWQYVGKTAAEDTYTINGVMTARKAGGRTRTKAEMLAIGAQNEGKHAKHKYVLLREPANAKEATPVRRSVFPRGTIVGSPIWGQCELVRASALRPGTLCRARNQFTGIILWVPSSEVMPERRDPSL